MIMIFDTLVEHDGISRDIFFIFLNVDFLGKLRSKTAKKAQNEK